MAVHVRFLRQLVDDPAVVALVAEVDSRVAGLVTGRLVTPPPVYDPGGPSGFIDEFVVVEDDEWPTTGTALLVEAAEALRRLGAAQLFVVCGHHDQAKRAALSGVGLALTSEWYVAPVATPRGTTAAPPE